ncbi:AcrR family transcriptional regulator [Parvibaculum indicum]|uniref:TetR/AcrR family transcriptional regulator n=1 Tax=Parvibaculum indicum TaxID=562969 RepID=UPI0014207662|nr:TetR/AcrR family transcriptional regulator [Parvibaculum indicum]NIJ41182.1 AcrR family transcriptional regulator [Parvibaculum indicum]
MRKKSEKRLEQIAEGAVDCFTELGFRRAQMADIAKAAGVSVGTLYLYVTGKEALLHLAILRACERPLEGLALPLKATSMRETVKVVAARRAEIVKLPSLAAALGKGATPGIPELGAIGGEFYDLMHGARRAVWLMNRLALEISEIDALQATAMRGDFRDELAAVALKIVGRRGKPGPDLKLAARIALEAISWTAMHRMRETPANAIEGLTEEIAREAAAHSFASTLISAATEGRADSRALRLSP